AVGGGGERGSGGGAGGGHVGAVLERGAGGGQRERAARADGEDALLRGDQVAGAGDQERGRLVGDDQERLELAEHLVRAPVLGELDRGALEVAAVLLELGLETGEEREGVGRRARETGD